MLKLIQQSQKSRVQRLTLPFAGLLLGGALLLGVGSNSIGTVSAHTAVPHTTAAHALSSSMLSKQRAASQIATLKTEALSLQQQLEQEATTWSNQHTYFDSYDGKTYNLGYEYQALANYPTQYLLDSAQSVADYQYIIGQLQGWLANFTAYTSNFNDTTPYNQVHATDMQIMQQNSATTGQAVVISLAEQAMRVYQDGQLVNAFQVVTGKPDHPSLPGNWQIESKVTNTTFTSGKQPGQDGYYPPTPIAIAMQYHSDGYFIHQSWWRSQYGPNKQFPHMDPGGTLFANDGSHGCINMSTADVTWLYTFAQVHTTKIIIY
ncbi:MAG: L,D-transpeptidase [Ktedonobacteraceae bacterium]